MKSFASTTANNLRFLPFLAAIGVAGYSSTNKTTTSFTLPTLPLPHTRNTAVQCEGCCAPKKQVEGGDNWNPQRKFYFGGRFEESLRKYEREMEYSENNFKDLILNFVSEMRKGLLSKEKSRCQLKMLDTCVDVIPTGNEVGVYYAVDFGGTNLRVLRVELFGNGTAPKITQHKSVLSSIGKHPKGLLDKDTTASQLFSELASVIHKSVMENGDNKDGQEVKIGFTFSFPSEQAKLNQSILTVWTKDFETGRNTSDPVEGVEIGRLFKKALDSKGLKSEVVAILNDTVGTLISAAFESKLPVNMGVILGTGSNGCYVEPLYKQLGYNGSIVNMEYGNFSNFPESKPRTIDDIVVDQSSADRQDIGRQQFEKMMAGKYTGELVRQGVLRVYKEAGVPLPNGIYTHPNSLSPELVSKIYSDSSDDLREASWAFFNLTGRALGPSLEEYSVLKRVADAVFERSAALAASAIAAVGVHTGTFVPANKEKLIVAIDGAVYTQNPRYHNSLNFYLEKALGKECASKVLVTKADDGSGKGAAFLTAAVATKHHLEAAAKAQALAREEARKEQERAAAALKQKDADRAATTLKEKETIGAALSAFDSKSKEVEKSKATTSESEAIGAAINAFEKKVQQVGGSI